MTSQVFQLHDTPGLLFRWLGAEPPTVQQKGPWQTP